MISIEGNAYAGVRVCAHLDWILRALRLNCGVLRGVPFQGIFLLQWMDGYGRVCTLSI